MTSDSNLITHWPDLCKYFACGKHKVMKVLSKGHQAVLCELRKSGYHRDEA